MQAEIDELKKQLFERTGQLESASITILERNEDIQKLKQELDGHLQYISELEAKIKDLERILAEKGDSSMEEQQRLKDEIERLKREIEDLKKRFAQDFQE